MPSHAKHVVCGDSVRGQGARGVASSSSSDACSAKVAQRECVTIDSKKGRGGVASISCNSAYFLAAPAAAHVD